MQTALLLIDIQNDYFPGGRNELSGSEEAAKQAIKILNHFRMKQLPVIHIQHISIRSTATFFLPGTRGAEINEFVAPGEDENIIVKHYPNSFRETTLHDKLRQMNVTNLVICGMMTHMCVDSTVRAAFDAGYQCIVAQDACATKDLTYNGGTISADNVHMSFMSAINGMFATVMKTDDIR